MMDHFLRDASGVLSGRFAVWCSAVYTHLKLLDRAVSFFRFLTGGVFECDIAHRRSVVVLCVLLRSGVSRCTHLIMRYLDRM